MPNKTIDLNDVTINRVKDGEDPFAACPVLHTLWSYKKSALAAQYARDDAHTGSVFTIRLNNKVIGVSGFFTSDDDPEHVVRLRWTGVLRPYRRLGIARHTLDLLVYRLQTFHPEFTTLI